MYLSFCNSLVNIALDLLLSAVVTLLICYCGHDFRGSGPSLVVGDDCENCIRNMLIQFGFVDVVSYYAGALLSSYSKHSMVNHV